MSATCPSTLLDAQSLRRLLDRHPAWQHHDPHGGSISRDFVFGDFAEAFAFMAEVALWAQRLDHHPDWSNRYNRVAITLTTHDAGGLSARDFELASRIDRAFASRARPAA